MTHVHFNTTEYEFSHGHRPRGMGTWAFKIEEEAEPRWFKGTYTEAKRECLRVIRREYAEQNFSVMSVEVCS